MLPLTVLLSGAIYSVAGGSPVIVHPDPCANIAGKLWVSPQEARECFTSFKVNAALKANVIDVVNKTLAFHTSTNYQREAPPPFDYDVHEDILADLARISTHNYSSEFDMHVDLSRSMKRLNDGHCVYIDLCYDSLYLTYLPTPLVLLTNASGHQNIHIAPEAFAIASTEFSDEIDVWQDALPSHLRGNLSSISGAKVLLIDGADPFNAVDVNTLITGGYQSFGTRQNSFFSSYQRTVTSWNYVLGNFAQLSLPLADNVTLAIQRTNNTETDVITLPYRSRLSANASPWINSTTFRDNNCVASFGTNGVDLYGASAAAKPHRIPPIAQFQQQPPIPLSRSSFRANVRERTALNVMLDTTPIQNVVLPPALTPNVSLPGSNGVAQFHSLEDGKTGVLVLGSFAGMSEIALERALLDGLANLKNQNATQLIVDVTNNGGGYICVAHFLHRILVGPKDSTIPQAGLDTTTRAGPLAQLIVQNIFGGTDPEGLLLYNPINWAFPNGTLFPAKLHWLRPPTKKVVNGVEDAFSPRMMDMCQPFNVQPPDEPLFDPKKTVIISNGRCASSCALFSITMAKLEGAKTVVVGGKADVKQQYCGVVGGQSTDFSTVDTEVKTTHLKGNPLAPPNFLTNSVQGITWRLGFGIDNPNEPEEWQDHPADINLPLTAQLVNNPRAIWEVVAKTVLHGTTDGDAGDGLEAVQASFSVPRQRDANIG